MVMGARHLIGDVRVSHIPQMGMAKPKLRAWVVLDDGERFELPEQVAGQMLLTHLTDGCDCHASYPRAPWRTEDSTPAARRRREAD
jgi:hypothetical protein